MENTRPMPVARAISRARMLGGLAALLAAAACSDSSVAPRAVADTPENVRVADGIVYTPSGAAFPEAEWKNGSVPHAPYLIPAEETVARTQATVGQKTLGALKNLVGAASSYKVLCYSASTAVCGILPTVVPGVLVTYWTDAQWSAASIADFQQFNMIYIPDQAGNYSGIVASKNKWGTATNGRIALTGVHYEHCNSGSLTGGPCTVLKGSANWILGDSHTGLLASTAVAAANWMPTVAPYAGVTYSATNGGWNLVHITDPGHATMQGSTDASLSNFGSSSHSLFGNIGSFTSVADICSTNGSSYPSSCAATAWRPDFLVVSVAIHDQDGDGIPDATDNCPTVSNSNQADANGNGVGDACESAPTVTVAASATNVAPGTSVTFTATAQDADNALNTLTYEWRVNGIVQQGATSSTFTASVSANTTVRVTVRDPGSLSGFAESVVTVITNRPPTINAPTPVSGNEGSAIVVGVTANDPDNDPLTYKFDIDGDNVVDSVNTVGSVSLVYGDQGVHLVGVTVDDGKGNTATVSVPVTVANVAPTILSASAPATVTVGQQFSFVGKFSDPGTSDAPFAIDISWGDNTPPMRAFNTSGQFTIAHTYTVFGTYTISYTVTDKDGAVSQPATATVSTNDPTPPVITPSVTGTTGTNGWYTGDVSISWAVADAESGIATGSSHGCDASTLTSNTTAEGTTYTCSATNGGGIEGHASVTVKRDATAPTITPATSGQQGTNGWYTGDVSISFAVADAESGEGNATGCSATTLTTNNANAVYTCTATNGAGLSSTQSVTVKRDATVPVVTGTPSGTLGSNGWYTSNVSVSWSVMPVPGPSGITANCPVATLAGDSQGADYSCTATTGAGVATTGSVHVKRDASAPSLSPLVSGTLGNNGWYTSDVTVSWSAADATSGVAATPCAASTLGTDNAGTAFTCTATNGAGLSTTAQQSVKRDATAPVVTYTGNAGSYTVDQTIAISCSASDAMSGIASATCANVNGSAYSFTLGANTRSATATDRAGNTGSASLSFTVNVSDASLCALTTRFVSNAGVANSLCTKLSKQNYEPFKNELAAQTGKKISESDAAILVRLVDALAQR